MFLIQSMAYIYMKPCESHPARMKAHGALQKVNTSPGQGEAPNPEKVPPLGCSRPCGVPSGLSW